jgi:cation diffusion facilitator CzcD-associated flavoprotein CzcO/acetyl esterase/lipase
MALAQITPTGLREALLAPLLRGVLKLALKPAFSPRWSIPAQRRWLAGMSHLGLPPRGVTVEPATVGGVPAEWVRPSDGTPRQGTVLYLHGGAYCVGNPRSHRPITGALARATGMAVLVLDYRLAPEHPQPAALHDALAACRELSKLGPLVLAGDSAGGGLALATTLAMRNAGETLPAALYLIAPWVDLTLQQLPAPTLGEAMLSAAWARDCAAKYLGGGDAAQPLVSPLRADLRGLPPVLMQLGTDDLLHDEGLRLHAALQAAQVAVTCEVIQNRWHVFQLNAGALPCADAALQRAGDFLGQQVDAVAAAAAGDAVQEHTVVILGGGMSGLCTAVQLKKAGQHDFVVLEQSPGLGGTWWDNRYPGAQVDVPAPLYSFSFAPNPRWRRRFASAPEIQAYMVDVAHRFGVLPHMRFGTRLTSARFDEAAGHWHFETANGRHLRSRFFVCSTGPLSQARWPDIPGLDRFAGPRLHSARWDHSVPLQGQRVAVIGTGSTASQLIPPIAAQAAQLQVYQRTANWVLPRLDRRYNALDRALAHVPPYAAMVRANWYRLLELGRKGFDEGSFMRRRMLGAAAAHLRAQVPDATLRQALTPPYPLGCKRLIYSNDYLATFARPNTELVTAAIERITPTGIVTVDGRERPVDALVCATGFDTVQLLQGIKVTGRGGLTLRQSWADGPQAWHGLTVAGFPNMFLMLGPNTATGHTSTLLYIEPGVRYAMACMQKVLDSGQRWLDIKPEVFKAHNLDLQARLAGSVWTTCRSWYRTEGGKVVALWPGFTAEYQQAIARPDFAAYTFA